MTTSVFHCFQKLVAGSQTLFCVWKQLFGTVELPAASPQSWKGARFWLRPCTAHTFRTSKDKVQRSVKDNEQLALSESFPNVSLMKPSVGSSLRLWPSPPSTNACCFSIESRFWPRQRTAAVIVFIKSGFPLFNLSTSWCTEPLQAQRWLLTASTICPWRQVRLQLSECHPD